MASYGPKGFPYGFPYQVGVTGTTYGGMPITDVPTSPTDLIAKDTFIFQASFTNNSGSDRTITIADKQASPKYAMEATTISSGTTVSFNWEEGLFLYGGLTWSVSGTGVDGSVVAFYKA